MAPVPPLHATLRDFSRVGNGEPVVKDGGMGKAAVTQNPHETAPRLQSGQVGLLGGDKWATRASKRASERLAG